MYSHLKLYVMVEVKNLNFSTYYSHYFSLEYNHLAM